MSFTVSFPTPEEKLLQLPSQSAASSRGSHQLMATLTCERYYTFKYLYNMVPGREPPWRGLGSAVHEALAWHYAAMLPKDKRPDWWAEGNLLESISDAARGEQRLIDTALDVYEYYKLATVGDSFVPVAVEREFRATLGELDPDNATGTAEDDEVVTCRSDLVVQMNGGLWIVDHKCMAGDYKTGELEKWQDDGPYMMSFQVMMNLHLVARTLEPELGLPVKGFIIQRIKRKRPFTHDRNKVTVPRLALASAPSVARELVRREKQVADLVRIGKKPVPNFNQCHNKWGACEFRDICASDSDDEKKSVIRTGYITRKRA